MDTSPPSPPPSAPSPLTFHTPPERPPLPSSPSRVLAGIAFVLSGGTGLLTLAAWTMDQWQIVTFGTDSIPMAPMTALLFVVLSLAQFSRLVNGGTPARERVILAFIALAALAALAELSRDLHGLSLPWDAQGFGIETAFGLIAIGRMAPLTAVCFLLAALSAATRSAGPGQSRLASWAGSLAAFAGLLIAGVVVLGYAAGTPLDYRPGRVPMALLTALAFIALLGGHLLTDRGGELLAAWRRHEGEESEDAPHVARYLTPGRIIAFSMLALAVLSGGFFYLRSNQTAARLTLQATLTAVVDLKANEIEAWRLERLGDARVATAFPSLARVVSTLGTSPGPELDAQADLAAYLTTLRAAYAYKQIVVLDRTLNPVLNVPAGAPWDRELSPALREKITTSRNVLIEDLHRGRDGHVHLDLLAPVRSEDGQDFAGAVLLTIDTETLLFPLVRSWPSPSESAETLLIRREGDSIVYLNDLSHRAATALNLRAPLASPHLLAARALRSASPDLLEGTDYRGVPVLGVARPVLGSPWTLIAQMDQAEAYAPLKREAWKALGVFTLLAALGALFLQNGWRQARAARAARLLAQESLARAASERLALVMRQANDAILLFDADLRVTDANERALETYGYTLGELRQLTARELRAAGSTGTTDRDFANAVSANGVRFETVHRRKDGSTFPVEVSSRPIKAEGRRDVLSIIRDITQLKLHEHEIERVNRLYFVISQVNQALVRAKGRHELFSEICRVLVEAGRFRIAWIGLFNPVTLRLDPVACAGDEFGYITTLTVSSDPALPESRGPSGTAFREERTYVCNDFFADPFTAPWRERAAPSGFHSSIALPLRRGGETVGVLTVYSEERGFFAQREVGLLEETAGDISFALDLFATEERRHQTEAALHHSEERFRALFQDISAVPIQGYSADGTTRYWNKASEQLYGYTAEEALGRNLLDLIIPPELHQSVTAAIRQMAATGQSIPPGELSLRRKDGSQVEVYSSHALVRRPGQPDEFFCVDIDITERKRAEAQQRLSATALDSISQGVLITGRDRLILSANKAFQTISGFNEAEILGLNCKFLQGPLTDPATVEAIRSALHREVEFAGEILNYRKDGTAFWNELTISPTRDSQGAVTHYVGVTRDITARKIAEDKLRQLSRIVEQAPLAIAITNLDGNIEYANPAFCAVSGYGLSEVLGQNPRVLKSGRTDPAVYRGMWQALTSGEIWRGELSNKKKSGELYDESVVIAPVTDETGKITNYVALKQDITERKAREVELHDSEKRFRELFDLESDAILVFEAESGLIVQANEAAVSAYGYSLSELLCLHTADITAEPDKSLALLAATRSNVDQVMKVPFRLHRKRDGTVFPVELSIRTFQRAAQPMLVAVVRDITEQVRIRERLERFNAELEATVASRTEEMASRTREIEALLQSVPDLVLRARSDGTVLDVRPAKGATPLAAITVKPEEQNHLATLVLAALPLAHRALAENTTVALETELPLGTGPLPTELRVAPVGQGEFVVFARDISERKRFEAAMVAMLEKERQISVMKSRFIAVTSHEFRTPMAAAMASADLLHNHLDHLAPAKREELFDRIASSLRRMTDMLDELLLLNRIEANRVEVSLSPLNLWDFTHNVIEEIRLGDRDAHRFEFDATGRTGHILSDSNLLHHILANLLSNAVRYSPAGSVITTRLTLTPGQVRISVEDQGIGVPEADRERIFEPFERGSNVGVIKGTGLGLNIVKRMCGLLGGSITCEAPPAGGSRFVLTLPRPAEPAPASP